MPALPYVRIADALEEIGRAPRNRKADIAAAFLIDIPHESLCTTVRLLAGALWPSWEPRELGIGPRAVTAALEEVSKEDVASLFSTFHDMGAVAEFALQHKAQNPLSASPLEAFAVYDALRKVSKMSGPKSQHRKIAALSGLMMDASPLEGKYIVRTALGNTAAGLGPRTLVEALSQSSGLSGEEVIRAYNLMPDPGMLAQEAGGGTLSRIKIQPPRPIRPMLLRQRHIGDAALPAAHLPLHQGLKVQVHMTSGQIYFYTARLKNIAAALAGLAGEMQGLARNHEMILEAQLMGFLKGGAICLAEVVRHINRRHFARRSRTEPALMAYDLLYLDGKDITGLTYVERRKRLIDILGEPEELPFHGISPAKEMILGDAMEARTLFDQVKAEGGRGLMVRDLRGLYSPGCYSSSDLLLRKDDDFKAL